MIKSFRVPYQDIDALVFEPKSGMASAVLVSFSAIDRESNYDRWPWLHACHERETKLSSSASKMSTGSIIWAEKNSP